MGGYGDVQLLRDDGLRLDGRKIDEMRPVTVEAGVLPAADGPMSHMLKFFLFSIVTPINFIFSSSS